MTSLLWCLVFALVTPYVPYLGVFAVKFRQGYDNHLPREQSARLEGWPKRAFAAHQNGFEALPQIIVAALVAHVAGVDSDAASHLAIGWILARVAYSFAYIADMPLLRSTLWTLAVLCVLALIVLTVVSTS